MVLIWQPAVGGPLLPFELAVNRSLLLNSENHIGEPTSVGDLDVVRDVLAVGYVTNRELATPDEACQMAKARGFVGLGKQ
jgi:hypothetical protein